MCYPEDKLNDGIECAFNINDNADISIQENGINTDNKNERKESYNHLAIPNRFSMHDSKYSKFTKEIQIECSYKPSVASQGQNPFQQLHRNAAGK